MGFPDPWSSVITLLRGLASDRVPSIVGRTLSSGPSADRRTDLTKLLGLGILRSLWRCSLVTYEGREVIKRRRMNWNACKVLVLDGFFDSHSGMPQSQAG
ncbi:hypothetical protein QTP88_002319 [Uroleucon formosanum]